MSNLTLAVLSGVLIFLAVNLTNKGIVLELRPNDLLFKEIAFLCGCYIIGSLAIFFVNPKADIFRLTAWMSVLLIILTSFVFSFKSHQTIIFATVSLFAIPSVFLSAVIYVLFSKENSR